MFMFNTLYDTDFGLLYMIKNKFADPEYFNLSFFEENDTIRKLVKSVYHRENKNPLSLIINDKYKDQIDDIYNQYFSQMYTDILKYSCYTGLYYFIKVLKISNDIVPYIFCINDEEVDVLNQDEYIKKNISIITKKEIIHRVRSINQFYIKSLYGDPYVDLLYQSLKKKTIYIEDYTFNFDKNNQFILDDHSVEFINNMCFFNIITAYDIKKLEGENKEDVNNEN